MKHSLSSCLPFRCHGSLEAGATFDLKAALDNKDFHWSYFSVSDKGVIGDSFLEAAFPYTQVDSSDVELSKRKLIEDCLREPDVLIHFTDFGYGYLEVRFQLEGELGPDVVGAYQRSSNLIHHVLSTDISRKSVNETALRSVVHRKISDVLQKLNCEVVHSEEQVVFSNNYSDAIFTVGGSEASALESWRSVDASIDPRHSMSELSFNWAVDYNLSYYHIEDHKDRDCLIHVQSRSMVAWAILDDLSRRAIDLLRRSSLQLEGIDGKKTIAELSAYRRIANLSQLILLPERAAGWGSIKLLYDDIWEKWGFDELCTAAQRGIQAASDELISAHAERRSIQDRRIGVVLFLLTVLSSIGIVFSWIDFSYSADPPGGNLRNIVATWSPVFAGFTALVYLYWSTRRR